MVLTASWCLAGLLLIEIMLPQVNAISESQLTDELKNFLELNMPKVQTGSTALPKWILLPPPATSSLYGLEW